MLHNETHFLTPGEQPADDGSTPLTDYTGPQFVAFSEGYASGYVAGIERGRQLADDEASALWRNAARVVHELANIPERDAVADAEQASKRAAWWVARLEGRPE